MNLVSVAMIFAMSLTPLIFVKSIHMIALVALLWASLRKNMLLSPLNITSTDAIKANHFDLISASAAFAMLLSGFAMAYWFAKPSSYYFASTAFWAKLTIFSVASVFIYWTKRFIRQAKSQDVSPVPKAVRWILRFDFLGVTAMASLGILIAHGN